MAEAAVQNVTTTHRVKKKNLFFPMQQATHNSLQGFFTLRAPAIYRNMDVLPNISKLEEGSHLTRRSKFCAKKTFWGSLLFGLLKLKEVLFPKTDMRIGQQMI